MSRDTTSIKIPTTSLLYYKNRLTRDPGGQETEKKERTQDSGSLVRGKGRAGPRMTSWARVAQERGTEAVPRQKVFVTKSTTPSLPSVRALSLPHPFPAPRLHPAPNSRPGPAPCPTFPGHSSSGTRLFRVGPFDSARPPSWGRGRWRTRMEVTCP